MSLATEATAESFGSDDVVVVPPPPNTNKKRKLQQSIESNHLDSISYQQLVKKFEVELQCVVCCEVPIRPVSAGCQNDHVLCLECWMTLRLQGFCLFENTTCPTISPVSTKQFKHTCPLCQEVVGIKKALKEAPRFYMLLWHSYQQWKELKSDVDVSKKGMEAYISNTDFSIPCPFVDVSTKQYVSCTITGGKFSNCPADWEPVLNNHVKVCKQLHPCNRCSKSIPICELEAHLIQHNKLHLLSQELSDLAKFINQPIIINEMMKQKQDQLESLLQVFKVHFFQMGLHSQLQSIIKTNKVQEDSSRTILNTNLSQLHDKIENECKLVKNVANTIRLSQIRADMNNPRLIKDFLLGIQNLLLKPQALSDPMDFPPPRYDQSDDDNDDDIEEEGEEDDEEYYQELNAGNEHDDDEIAQQTIDEFFRRVSHFTE